MAVARIRTHISSIQSEPFQIFDQRQLWLILRSKAVRGLAWSIQTALGELGEHSKILSCSQLSPRGILTLASVLPRLISQLIYSDSTIVRLSQSRIKWCRSIDNRASETFTEIWAWWSPMHLGVFVDRWTIS